MDKNAVAYLVIEGFAALFVAVNVVAWTEKNKFSETLVGCNRSHNDCFFGESIPQEPYARTVASSYAHVLAVELMMRLQDRVALITAGDCRVGRRVASLLASHGAHIVLCGVDRAAGTKLVHRLEQEGAKARFYLVDVATPSDVEAAIKGAVATFGRIDILCNNASFSLLGDDSSVLDLTAESWERIVDLSLQGVFWFSQYALPFLRRSPTGSIINVVPYPRKGMHVVEGTGRGWIMAMTRDIAEGASKAGVRVNLIWPHVAVSGATLSSYQASLANKVFRMAKRDRSAARAIARAALYLACDDSAEVTGAMVVVDADYPQWA